MAYRGGGRGDRRWNRGRDSRDHDRGEFRDRDNIRDRDKRGEKDFRDRRRRPPRDRGYKSGGRDRDDRDFSHSQTHEEDKGEIVVPTILTKPGRSQRDKEQLEHEFPSLGRKEFTVLRKEDNSPAKEGKTENSTDHPAHVVVKARESERGESPSTTAHRPPRRPSGSEKASGKMRQPLKLIDEINTFSEAVSDYLTDNQEFFVVGVVGLQNAGKSTILNILARAGVNIEDDLFRVQTYEHQMLGEHCTNGVDIYIDSKRMIFLDCHPLISAGIMDRAIQLEKKYHNEFGFTEKTIEMQSLQVIGWMYSVCHCVLVVQDWFLDMNLMRVLQTAEMLKPCSPIISEKDQQVTEYFPHLVLVQNKCDVADFETDRLQEMTDVYGFLMAKSRLDWKDDNDNAPHFVLIPDQELERGNPKKYRVAPRHNYEESAKQLRRKIFGLKRKQLGSSKLTEKGWLMLAAKAWDSIKNSSTYLEFCRLLP